MASELLNQRDLEYNDLEREELLSGEPRFAADEERNSTMAMVFGGVAGVLCLVAMILTWILFYRERTRTFLWHAIWLIFATLFGFACAGWGAVSASAIKQNKQPNASFTLIIFIGAIIFAIYLLAETFWLVFYRHNHFSYLASLKADQGMWDARLPSGSSFEDGWKSSRRMMWWVTFFTAISGVLFAFIAYAARSVVWNRYQLTRITLYLVALGMVLGGFLMIYWSEEAFEYQNLSTFDFGGRLISFLKGLGIAAVVLGLLLAVVNLLRYKWAYFILGLALLIFMVLLVVGGGSLWREIRWVQEEKATTRCADVLSPIHENNLENVCVNGKYSATTCTKEYIVNRWEGGRTDEIKSLNPGCCQLATTWYNHPFQQLAFWTLITILVSAVAASFCLYLSDTSEYLSNAYRKVTAIDYVLFVLPILLAIGFGLYFIFRPKNEIKFGTQSYIRSFESPYDNKVVGFDPVPKQISSGAAPVSNANGCYDFDTSSMINPQFSDKDPICTTDCVERVALFSFDSTFTLPSDLSGANIGSNARNFFFPGCTEANSNFVFLFGTNEQLKTVLNKVKICTKAVGKNSVVLFRHDQQKQSAIAASGLNATEEASVSTGLCGAGFTQTQGQATCLGSCKFAFTHATAFALKTMKGSLFYINAGQIKKDIHADVKVEATSNNEKVGTVTELISEGIFIIRGVPRYPNSSYILTLTFSDPKNVFITKKVDVLVDRDMGSNEELSAGSHRLLTTDGGYCAPDNTTCISNRKSLNGTVGFTIRDASDPESTEPATGTTVTITQQQAAGGSVVATLTTDESGNVKSGPLAYGSYTATYTKGGFVPASTRLDLQEPNLNAVPVMLSPLTDSYDMRVVAEMNEPSADFDLVLGIRSDKGKDCIVSPINKYCPYAAHLSDIKQGVGQEVIGIKQLAVANYISMITPSPAYSATCSAEAALKDALAHYQGWNWESFKVTRSLEDLEIVVRTLGNFLPTTTDSNGNIVVAISKELPVETPDQAAVLKTLLAVDGTPLPAEKRRLVSTNVVGQAVGVSDKITKIISNTSETINLTDGKANITTVKYTVSSPNEIENFVEITNLTFYNNKTNESFTNTTFDGRANLSVGGVVQEKVSTGYKMNGSIFEANLSNGTATDKYTETKIGDEKILYQADTVIFSLGQKDFNYVFKNKSSYSIYDKLANKNETFSNLTMNFSNSEKKTTEITLISDNSTVNGDNSSTSTYSALRKSDDVAKTASVSLNTSALATEKNGTVEKSSSVTLMSEYTKTATDIANASIFDNTSSFVNGTTKNTDKFNNKTSETFKVATNEYKITNTLVIYQLRTTASTKKEVTNYTTIVREKFNTSSNTTEVTSVVSYSEDTSVAGDTKKNTTYSYKNVYDYVKKTNETWINDVKVVTPAPTRRLLTTTTNAHMAGGKSNFMLVSCFTGYGTASLVELNIFSEARPSYETCAQVVANYRPKFTVENLRKAVDALPK